MEVKKMADVKNIQWIRNIITDNYTVKNYGVDLNNDGEITSAEKLPDYDKNDGLEPGTKEDFWMFLEYNKEQIASSVEFVGAAIQVNAQNPINQFLYENQGSYDYKKLYDFIADMTTKLKEIESKDDQLNYLISIDNYQEILNDNELYPLLVKSCAFELDINAFVAIYNKAVKEFKDENYSQVVSLVTNARQFTDNEEHLQLAQGILFSAYYNDAVSKLGSKQYLQAEEIIFEAVENAGNDEERSKAQNLQGLIYRHQGLDAANQGNFAEAVDLYLLALEHLNNESDIQNCQRGIAVAYYNYANREYQQQNYDKAIELYSNAIENSSEEQITNNANKMIANSYFNKSVVIFQEASVNDLAKYAIARDILATALEYAVDAEQTAMINDFLIQIEQVLEEN